MRHILPLSCGCLGHLLRRLSNVVVIVALIGLFPAQRLNAQDQTALGAGQNQPSYAVTGPITFVQITDTHIGADVTKTYVFGRTNAYDNLKVAVKEIDELNPDFVIHSGDIAASKGFVTEYENFKKVISELKPPIHYTIGNHDDRAHFRQVLLGENDNANEYYYSFTHKNVHFVVLDSRLPTGKAPGQVSEDQLVWLRGDLEKNKDKLTFIILHHHVIRVSPDTRTKLDGLRLLNSKEFLEVIRQFPNARYVLSGHVHLPQIVTEDGKTFITTPSLAYQFSPTTVKLEHADMPPSYRIFTVDTKGRVKVYLKPLGGKAREEAPAGHDPPTDGG